VLSFVARRLGLAVVQIAVIAVVTFVVLRLLPQDPASVFAGSTAGASGRAVVSHQLGLDKPIISQLGSFISGVFHGTWGKSWVTQHSVVSEIGSHITTTLSLVFGAMLISLILGLLLGFSIAVSDSSAQQGRRRPGRALGMGFILTSGSQPDFWWGLVFIEVFYKILGWFPVPIGILGTNIAAPRKITSFIFIDGLITGDFTAWWSFTYHLLLPILTICLVLVGPIAKVVRESLLPVMSSAYFTNLRTQGAGRMRLLRCVVRNGGAPVLMVLGVLFGAVLGGAALIESVFSLNGLAQFTIQSILGADYPMVEACVVTLAGLSILGYLIADILATLLNPALRLSGQDGSGRRLRTTVVAVDRFGGVISPAISATAEPVGGVE
jgi:ABC-type dipeptide/oligopeptide/nickel transport system permease component